jgi:hypothetical protein
VIDTGAEDKKAEAHAGKQAGCEESDEGAGYKTAFGAF